MKYNFIGQQDWPTQVVMPAGGQQFAEWAIGFLVAAFVLWGIRNLVTRRDSALLICMISGGAACVMEPHLMRMFKFFYPEIGQHIFLVGFGHPIPNFIPLSYSAFFGPATYFFMTSRMARNFNLKGFLLGMTILVAAETVFEVTSINAGIWLYFGNQPFTILNFPIHVAVIIGCACVMLGAVSRIWFDRISGAQQWWMLILCPLFLIAVFNAFIYTVAFALASDGGVPAARIGSITSMILAMVISYRFAKALSRVPDLSARSSRNMTGQPYRDGAI